MRLPKEIGPLADLTALTGVAITAGVVALGWLRTPFEWIFGYFVEGELAHLFAEGCVTTITVGSCAIVSGTLLGFLLAYGMRLALQSRRKAVTILIQAFLYISLAIPVYVLLVYFGPHFSSPWAGGVTLLAVNLAVFVAKLVLGAFEAVPRAQMEAAIATGAHGLGLWWSYERAALWRICGPGIVNEWATTFKLSSLVGTIGVFDIMNAAKTSLLQNYNMWAFVAVVVVYVLLIVPICIVADRLALRV